MISPECKNGHTSERNAHGKCIVCTREAAARWRATHAAQNAEGKAAWQKANADHVNARQREWRAANPGKAAAYSGRWNAANPAVMAAICARRRAKKLHAVPPWADPHKTAAVYREANELRRLGLDIHVDHFYPLQGETVSGLHVHTNLRVMLASENRAKGNRSA